MYQIHVFEDIFKDDWKIYTDIFFTYLIHKLHHLKGRPPSPLVINPSSGWSTPPPLGNLVTLRVTRRKLGIAFFDQAGDSEMRSKMRSNTKRKDAFWCPVFKIRLCFLELLRILLRTALSPNWTKKAMPNFHVANRRLVMFRNGLAYHWGILKMPYLPDRIFYTFYPSWERHPV